jgi:hypothetical protein
MRKVLIFSSLFFVTTFLVSYTTLFAPSLLKGAWQTKNADGNTVTMICADNYLMFSVYNSQTKTYTKSGGGAYKLEGTPTSPAMSFTREFFTEDSTKVGQTLASKFTLKGQDLTIDFGPLKGTWQRLDEATDKTPMAASWRISQREGTDGKMSVMQRGPRKTIKILSGTRFQWAAINTDTKQFFGTGGGNYTIKNGKYAETIEFFSRDSKKVGATLTFDYSLKDNRAWEHTGVSSTGTRVHEIWEKEE